MAPLFHLTTWLPFLRDVDAYITRPSIRRAVVNQVRHDLESAAADVVVAHSLGAVVALEAIARAGLSSPPALVITAGAPLAFPWFREHWGSEALEWMSSGRVRWLNLVDLTDDVTACVVPPDDVYGRARHVVVNNDHHANRLAKGVASWFGPEAGVRSTHRVQHYLNHPSVHEELARVMPHAG